MPPPRLYLEVSGDSEKLWPCRLWYATIVNRVLDIIRIKLRHLKSENKWESSRRRDSNGLGIGGLKATN